MLRRAADTPAGTQPSQLLTGSLEELLKKGAWFKSLRARVTLFSMDGGVVPAVNDGRTRPSRQSGPTLYTAKCYPGLNQAKKGNIGLGLRARRILWNLFD
jgi:hypothetical protein